MWQALIGPAIGALGGLLGKKSADRSAKKMMQMQLENSPFHVYRDQANALVNAMSGLAGSPINMPYSPDMPGGGRLPMRTGYLMPAMSLRSMFSQQFPEYAATALPPTYQPPSGKTGQPGVPNGTGPLAQMIQGPAGPGPGWAGGYGGINDILRMMDLGG